MLQPQKPDKLIGFSIIRSKNIGIYTQCHFRQRKTTHFVLHTTNARRPIHTVGSAL